MMIKIPVATDKRNDAIGKDEPVTQAGELAREEAILGQDGCQARKTGEAGVGSHCQDQHGRKLDHYIGESAPEQPACQGREDRLVRTGDNPQELGQTNASGKQNPHQDCHDDQRAPGILRFRRLKSRHAIADGFNTGQGGTTGGKGVQDQKQGQRLDAGGATDATGTRPMGE